MVPGSRPVGGNNYNGAPLATSAEDDVIPVPGPPLVVPLLMADPLEKQSETILLGTSAVYKVFQMFSPIGKYGFLILEIDTITERGSISLISTYSYYCTAWCAE